MKKKLQIFVSSTFTDMKSERQAAVEAILKSGNIPAGMELFTAGNESQLQTIIRWIDESDIYVLLLGGRYGSIEPTSGLSYTEVEYDYAVSQKKPYFAIVVTEEALMNKLKVLGNDAIEQIEPLKLEEFRKKVLSNISSFYTEIKDIKLGIHETLQDFKERYDFSGWVSGKNIENIEALLEDNRQLRSEVKSLSEKSTIKEQHGEKVSGINKTNEEELEELTELFDSIKIKTNKFNTEGIMKEYTLLQIIVLKRNSLVAGVYNRGGTAESERFLFFNIFPRLATHDLAESQPVNGVAYRRFSLTKKGLQLLAYLDKKMFTKK